MPIPFTSKIYDVGIFPTTRTITSMKTRIFSKPFGSPDERIMAAVSSFSGGGSSKTVEEIKGIGMGDIILDLAAGETTIDDLSISRAAFFGDNLLQAMGFAGGVDGLLRTLQGVRYPVDLSQQIIGFVVNDGVNQWYDDPQKEYEFSKKGPLTKDGYVNGNFAADASNKFYNAYQISSGNLGKMTETDLANRADGHNGLSISVITYAYENCWITSWQKGDYSTSGGLITESMNLKCTRVTNGDADYWSQLQKTAFTFGASNSSTTTA